MCDSVIAYRLHSNLMRRIMTKKCHIRVVMPYNLQLHGACNTNIACGRVQFMKTGIALWNSTLQYQMFITIMLRFHSNNVQTLQLLTLLAVGVAF